MSQLFSTALSSMQTHTQGIELRANNIANVNTAGYKSQMATFKTLFSQNLRPARAATATIAGLDPQQVGAGVRLGTTSTDFNQGSIEYTGQSLDLSLLGDGFFVLKSPVGGHYYTRDGQLTLDADGRLTQSSSGLAVQGLLVDQASGTIPENAVPEDIIIPPGLTLNAQATTESTIAGNLDAEAATGDLTTMQWQYYDSLGVDHVMTITFTKNAAANTWDWEGTVEGTTNSLGTGQLVFNSVGDVSSGGTGTATVTAASTGVTAGATDPQAVTLDFSTMTQYSASAEVQATNQDGFPPGSMTDVTIDDQGTVSAVFSNGQNRPLATLAIANFSNVQGLERRADNLFAQSANTGSPQIVTAGRAGVGTVQSQAVERSNTDLATELTQMIVLQRGYQAATRLISTADEMLQDALSLKR